MSELPWFKFQSDKWLAGNIQGYDMQTQGIYINLCARIWQNGGELEVTDRLAFMMHLDKQVLAIAIQLLEQGEMLVRNDDGCLSSKFILLQLEDRHTLSDKRAQAGRKGGKAKQLAHASNCQASAKQKGSNIEVEEEVEKDITPKAPKGAKRKRFVKPTQEEVTAYGKTIDFSVDGDSFCDYYEARGWSYGTGKPMKDWKAAVRTWKKNNHSKTAGKSTLVNVFHAENPDEKMRKAFT